jgi:hypothetical protein
MADTHSSSVAPFGPAGHHDPDVHHETTDVSARGVVAFAIGLLIAAGLIHLLVWLLFLYFSDREMARGPLAYPLAVSQQERVPPAPRLQTNPRADLRTLRAQEDQILNSYGWVDQSSGIVRIPIAEAMKLTVQRGLPVRREKP